MSVVRARYLAGTEVVFENCETVYDVKKHLCALHDTFIPAVYVLDDGAILANSATPPACVSVLVDTIDTTSQCDWRDTFVEHAEAADADGLERAFAACDDIYYADDICGHALHLVAGSGPLEAVTCLLDLGASMEHRDADDGHIPLHCAALSGFEDIVAFLIEQGSNVNATDDNLCTPLHDASTRGHNHIVETLLEAKANVHSLDNAQRTALHYATLSEHQGTQSVVKSLIEHKTKINQKDINGNTALHNAVRLGCKNNVFRLLEAGANINVQNINGRAPVHEASFNGHTSVLLMLLQRGANVHLLDVNFRNPLHAAAQNGKTECVRILLEYGATWIRKRTWRTNLKSFVEVSMSLVVGVTSGIVVYSFLLLLFGFFFPAQAGVLLDRLAFYWARYML